MLVYCAICAVHETGQPVILSADNTMLMPRRTGSVRGETQPSNSYAWLAPGGCVVEGNLRELVRTIQKLPARSTSTALPPEGTLLRQHPAVSTAMPAYRHASVQLESMPSGRLSVVDT